MGRWLGVAFLLVGAVPALAQEADSEEFRVFEADLGPAWIDVNAYPEEQRLAYATFARKCSRCHTLARSINSSMRGDEWLAYVSRMSRKPGSGISPGDADTILDFLVFDSERRERHAGSVDPELAPFLGVCEELAGVRRFPASTQDIRAEEGLLRVQVEGDRRLDLSRFMATDEGQELVKWTRRSPNRGEIVIRDIETLGGANEAVDPSAAPASVREALTEAVGSEQNPTECVELILDWLDETITREYREGTPEAEGILQDPRGDATEFTRAFVEVARAAGVPARPRLGFVARRTAFYMHTWAEVWLDGWVPVDPFLGQLPADATHLRLRDSGGDPIAQWDPRSVPGLDRLQLRVEVPGDESPDQEG